MSDDPFPKDWRLFVLLAAICIVLWVLQFLGYIDLGFDYGERW